MQYSILNKTILRTKFGERRTDESKNLTAQKTYSQHSQAQKVYKNLLL